MAFPCPGCESSVEANPESWFIRCESCGKLIRSRAHSSTETARGYEIEIVGQPKTRRRIEVPWTRTQQAHLERRLIVFSLATVGLVVLLYLVARWWTP